MGRDANHSSCLSSNSNNKLGPIFHTRKLAGPSMGGQASNSPLAECGWSSTLDKPQFHIFSTSWDFCGQDWVGPCGCIRNMSAVKV